MNENVTKLVTKGGKRMSKRKATTSNFETVHELPLMNPEITPQELLAKLSRFKNIDRVLVIFPEDDPKDPDVQHTHVVSANLTLMELNFLADKAKMSALGFEV